MGRELKKGCFGQDRKNEQRNLYIALTWVLAFDNHFVHSVPF